VGGYVGGANKVQDRLAIGHPCAGGWESGWVFLFAVLVLAAKGQEELDADIEVGALLAVDDSLLQSGNMS
jgi:hypothetical protein